MRKYLGIKDIKAIEVLDSRGNPTVQVDVVTENDFWGRALVPSGASTGSFEACELRDNDKDRYLGKGVLSAVNNVNNIISSKLKKINVYDQISIDRELIELDGTNNKSNLGANAILGVSLAAARAAAKSINMSLYNYIGGINAKKMPVPMINILNGGKHSDNNLSIQEFMIIPVGANSFRQCMQVGTEIYHNLKMVLKQKGYIVSVGDEGGFSPNLSNDNEAIQCILDAIELAGYNAGKDVAIGLDVASNEMYEEAKKINKEGYYFWKTDNFKTKEEMIKYLESLVNKYPIISIEDGLAEDDWEAWKKFTDILGKKIQIVGDDLFVTNLLRINKGIELGCANSVLIKPNQIGTLTETLDAIQLSKENKYGTIISHRSGETEDTFIADLAVAVNAGQIKTGATCRTDRTAKYNRLLNIEDELKK